MARKMTLALAAALTAVSLAQAAPAASVIDVNLEGTTLWVNGHTAPEAETIKIVLVAPDDDGDGREVFKRCVYAGTGATTYRCSLDVSLGSAALDRAGVWASRLVVDGVRIGRTTFGVGL